MKNKSIWQRYLPKRLVRLIQAIMTLIFLGMIYFLGLLPALYYWIFALIIISINGYVSYNMHKRKSREESMFRINFNKILSVLLSVLMLYLSVMTYQGNSFLNQMTARFQVNVISVIVLKDSNVKELRDLAGADIGTCAKSGGVSIANALELLDQEVENEVSVKDRPNILDNVKDLYNKKIDAILLNESTRYLIQQKHSNFNAETRVVHKFEIEQEIADAKDGADITEETTTIFISGSDLYADQTEEVQRSDVNILLTINPKNKQILMTTVPRDTYVELPKFKEMDKLTHASIYGFDESMNALSKFLDCKVDYYFRINFTSLMKIVDALGGITVDNPVEFSSTRDEDRDEGPYFYAEGEIELDGLLALTYCRERQVFTEGDNMRGQNQQRVLSALIKKASSSAIITRYSKILKAMEGSFETDIKQSQIKAFIQMQLRDMSSWDIQSQQLGVNPSSSTDCYSMPDMETYVSLADANSLKQLKLFINAMENNEKIDTSQPYVKTKKK